MKHRDLILTILEHCSAREEFGRTSLQKVAYLVGVQTQQDLGHTAHYYGPFSAQIEEDTEALALSGLLHEQTETLAFTGPTGRPAVRYRFAVTESGKARVEELAAKYPEQVQQVHGQIDRLVEVMGGLDQKPLSMAAKTYYISRKENSPLTPEEIRQLAKELNWTLTPRKVTDMGRRLAELGLVEFTEP